MGLLDRSLHLTGICYIQLQRQDVCAVFFFEIGNACQLGVPLRLLCRRASARHRPKPPKSPGLPVMNQTFCCIIILAFFI
jgi:hypothetical protein